LLYRLKRELYRLKKFVFRSHQNGLSFPFIIIVHAPRVFFNLVYAKLVKWINNRVLAVTINKILIGLFHKNYKNRLGGHFYVIVMPNTLHYLIPCLRLLPDDLQVFLIFNGTKSWERKIFLNEFSQFPGLKLWTLPRSSIHHGEVINLFFYANNANFGIIDHDLYIFDKQIFNHLTLKNDHSMKAIFYGQNRVNGIVYPHTFFLFFNTVVLKKIMQEYGVDARIYKKLTPVVQSRLAAIGLTNGQFIKDYINFFDTLHVLLALSYIEGFQVDYIDTDRVYHLGGTSMGSQYTKDLSHMYISMRFLEFVNHPLLQEKYLPYLAPFTSSEQIRQKLQPSPDVIQMQNTLNKILSLLAESRPDN